jgi:hypothetical protein
MPTPTKLVDVSQLNQALVIYDRAIRTLPYTKLEEISSLFKFNVMELAGKHSLILERRRAGGTQSYMIGKEFDAMTNLLGYNPSVIEPKDVVCITKENSKKYDDNELLIIGGSATSNVTKKHPLEYRVLQTLVISHMEDILYVLFHAERDDESTSPIGGFDGFFTKIDKMIVANAINVARGNLAISGEFLMPTDDTDYSAYENLVDWIGGAHNALRSSVGGTPQLLCSETVFKAARAAFRNKVRAHNYPKGPEMLDALREDAFCPSLEVVTNEILGRGSRLTLQKVGNMDLAFNTKAASKFVQVRAIYEDPNEWQFWLQSGYDTRVRDWHEKVFRTNEQKNENLDLSGDYCLTGAVMVNITGSDTGKWSIQGKVASRGNGGYIIGLTPGTYTVTFDAVDGMTKPADQQVTVTEGEVTTISGEYTAA